MSLFKRKDSPFWWIKLYRKDGRVVQRSSGTPVKRKAQELHDKLKAQLWDEDNLGAIAEHSWQEAVVRWLKETGDKKTSDRDVEKLRWLHPYLGHLMLSEITRDVIDSIIEARLETVSKSTANRYLALIRAILKRACNEWEWLAKAPKVRLFKESNARNRALTPLEVERLLAELPRHQQEMMLFALMTGLRERNITHLRWDSVDLERHHAYVTETKNGSPLAVPLNMTAMRVLEGRLGIDETYVFAYRGKPVWAASTRAWRNALKRAGIEDFRWHDLRHTWATWQRQAGTPVWELQRLGGWKTASMVERYAHVAPDQLSDAAYRIDDLATFQLR